jgi:DNA repair protein RadC
LALKKILWIGVRVCLARFALSRTSNQATVTEMRQIKAIGAVKAEKINAPMEMGKYMASKPMGMKVKLKSSQAFAEKFIPLLRNLKNEPQKLSRFILSIIL